MYCVIFPYDSQVRTTSLDECIVPDAFLLKHGKVISVLKTKTFRLHSFEL